MYILISRHRYSDFKLCRKSRKGSLAQKAYEHWVLHDETDGSDNEDAIDTEDGNGGGQLPNQKYGAQQIVGGQLPNQRHGGGQNVGGGGGWGQMPNQGHDGDRTRGEGGGEGGLGLGKGV